MGNVVTITATRFPTQGPRLGQRVHVCFHYDTSVRIGGLCVRDDYEAPWQSIFQLDDGRYVLGTECQYALEMR